MKHLEEIIQSIGEPDVFAAQAARARWDSVAKPLGSLGLFEETVIKMAALRQTADVRTDPRVLAVFCADHGVVAQGVTQCGSEVTAHVASALAEGRSTANTLAGVARCRVIPVDMGILDYPGHPGVRNLRLQNGSHDISSGPAMDRETCVRALERGAALVEELAGEGCSLLAVGEMGIGTTTSAAALAAALLNLPPEDCVGRGAGLSSEGLKRKQAVVRLALERNLVGGEDTLDLMAKLGGLEIAGMCGAFLGAAACRIPVVMDGMISSLAALCAVRICPRAEMAILPSHCSREPVSGAILRALGMRAPLDAGMHLGEGSGALMLMPLLDMALGVYHSGQSFDRLGIAAYQPLT